MHTITSPARCETINVYRSIPNIFAILSFILSIVAVTALIIYTKAVQPLPIQFLAIGGRIINGGRGSIAAGPLSESVDDCS